jgi:cysteine desulfurase/selenocysteine lyase
MNIDKIKREYDIFIRDEGLIYLDSCATSLTPRPVVAKILEYYNSYNANVARGSYHISTRATEEFELSREFVANFISAQTQEIVFTSGTTASLNMIAYGLANTISSSDNIITTAMEHHANFIPWQIMAKNAKAQFKIAPLTDTGELDVKTLLNLVNKNTKIVALTHVSNVLGTINPVKDIIQQIRIKNPKTIIVVDVAQSVAHLEVDVINLDCDFLAFSMHKLFGPTGVGVLYGKTEKLNNLNPMFTGGEMIQEVTSKCTTFRELPHRLEAGTPNIAGVIATQTAIDYINKFDIREIRKHELELMQYCTQKLQSNFGNDLIIYGPSDLKKRSGIISFTYKNYHPHDIATILDEKMNIAVRAGQHCAMPLHLETLKIPATTRASFSIYNEKPDIDKLVKGLKEVDKILIK